MVLDIINGQTTLQVLRLLCASPASWGVRECAKLIKRDSKTTNQAINHLLKHGIVRRETVGNRKKVSLSASKEARLIKLILEIEEKAYLSENPPQFQHPISELIQGIADATDFIKKSHLGNTKSRKLH